MLSAAAVVAAFCCSGVVERRSILAMTTLSIVIVDGLDGSLLGFLRRSLASCCCLSCFVARSLVCLVSWRTELSMTVCLVVAGCSETLLLLAGSSLSFPIELLPIGRFSLLHLIEFIKKLAFLLEYY